MTSSYQDGTCDQAARVSLFALQALPMAEAEAVRAHIDNCSACNGQMQRLRPIVDSLIDWPTDVLRPRSPLWPRLAPLVQSTREGNAAAAGSAGTGPASRVSAWVEPPWNEVSDGIFCKTLSMDSERNEMTLLVRLAPGVEYPPHQHNGVERLHLLDGDLWIGNRHLRPGDYNRAEPGTADLRVWTEAGCTCLLITSSQDILL